MKGELNRTVRIYVDSYENNIPGGQFHIASDPEVQSFHGMCQLLIDINSRLDRENFPQSFSELRKFHLPAAQSDKLLASQNRKRGAVATFSIRILFRQNASWQGSATWIEGNQEEYFRSVLELMVLLDNALGYAKIE